MMNKRGSGVTNASCANSVQANLSKHNESRYRIDDEIITSAVCQRWRYPPKELIPARTRGRLIAKQSMLFQLNYEIWLVQFPSGGLAYLSTEDFELANTLDRITRDILDGDPPV